MKLPHLHRARALALSLPIVPIVLGGCPQREPIGGCASDDITIDPDDATAWGTVLADDLERLGTPHRGTLTWHDGEDVLMVPKAGQALPVDAIAEIDPATARVQTHHSTEQTPVCEPDALLVDATVTFVRVDDGGVELSTPITLVQREGSSRYSGTAQLEPLDALDPGLVPLEPPEVDTISVQMTWGTDDTFTAEYDATGSSSDSPSTGQGVSQLVVDFSMP